MSEHTISFCTTCGGIKVTPPYPPNPTTAAYPRIDKACRCETEYDVQSELTSLRSHVAELQANEKLARETIRQQTERNIALTEKIKELQAKLVKWKPILWTDAANLPAIIERAKAEETERCAKILEAQDVDPTFKNRLAAAIRAEKP